MAQLAEQMGYQRFWVSEHHAFPTIAGSAPEVLLAALGAATTSIRLGSGGIMLPPYSAYKMAEVFSVLGNLYPDRIDMGIGRAPGADMSTARVLATDGRPKFERFPEQVEELTYFLRSETTHPLVSPRPPANLPVWMLGSSADSARLAAARGLPYNLGLFINPQATADLVHYYKRSFQASDTEASEAYAIITLSVFCAETEHEAQVQQRTFDVNFYRFITGQINSTNGGTFLTPEQAQQFPMTRELEAFIASRDPGRATGTPEQVKARLSEVAARYDADEVMAVTNMYYFEDRKRSFRLLMDAISGV